MEVSVQFHYPAALFPEKEPTVPIEWEAGFSLELVWLFRRREKSLVPAGIKPWIVRPIV
jgi:hypothetical protein